MIKKVGAWLLLIGLLTGCSQMEDLEWIDGEEYDELELEEVISEELEYLNKEYDLEVNIFEETED